MLCLLGKGKSHYDLTGKSSLTHLMSNAVYTLLLPGLLPGLLPLLHRLLLLLMLKEADLWYAGPGRT